MLTCQQRTLPSAIKFGSSNGFRRQIQCCTVTRCGIVTNGHYVTYINRSVGPDERVESGGTVVVRGDVDQDAYIQAAGDVMVWGRLSGHVHAGSQGNINSSISALELRGAHLVIAQVTSLAAARITVPGPHSATVSQVGARRVLQLLPLGIPHPPATTAGLGKSFTRWLQWYPAAAASLLTGAYALIAGLSLLMAPKTMLGLLFSTEGLQPGWIRLGGVLFATFGMQYLGTALVDWRLAHSSSVSSEGLPDMPFAPASPHASRSSASNSSMGSDTGTTGHLQQQQSADGGHSSTSVSHAAAMRTAEHAGPDVLWRTTAGSLHSQQQPALGMYGQPPSMETIDGRDGSSTSSVVQPHRADVQYASWLYSSTGFYEASVWSRIVLAVLFCGLVAVGQCQPGLLLLALLNFFGALGMMSAIKRQWCMHVMGDMPAAGQST